MVFAFVLSEIFASLGFFTFFYLLQFVILIGWFLIILVSFLLIIAQCRLAKYNSIKEAINLKEVINDIKRIGLLNLIGWVIIMCVLTLGVFGILILLGFLNGH